MTEITDTLSEHGIASAYPDVTMTEYVDLYGDPVAETRKRVVFADTHGYELNEWASVLDMDRGTLEARMLELAREVTDWNWSTSDPVVFEAKAMHDD